MLLLSKYVAMLCLGVLKLIMTLLSLVVSSSQDSLIVSLSNKLLSFFGRLDAKNTARKADSFFFSLTSRLTVKKVKMLLVFVKRTHLGFLPEIWKTSKRI